MHFDLLPEEPPEPLFFNCTSVAASITINHVTIITLLLIFNSITTNLNASLKLLSSKINFFSSVSKSTLFTYEGVIANQAVITAFIASCLTREKSRIASVFSWTISIWKDQGYIWTRQTFIGFRTSTSSTSFMTFLTFIPISEKSNITYTVSSVVCCFSITSSALVSYQEKSSTTYTSVSGRREDTVSFTCLACSIN